MTDHPKQSDPKGVNPSGEGPAQPKDVERKDEPKSTKQPGADTTSPESQAEADEDTYD
jgi:hypothetical protein